MLFEIRDFLQREQVASNKQIARALQIDIHALQPMIDLWLSKGVIECCPDQKGCLSHCIKCNTQPPVYYQYCGTKKSC